MGARSFAFCGSVGACAVTRLLNSRANNAVPNSIFFMAIMFVARRARLTGQLQSHGVAPDVAHADDHCCWNALSRDSERTSSQSVVFFFQAEDGIRDLIVTGVQTCALPI